MTGDIIIDGIDVFDRFGAYVTSGGWAALAAWPPLKKPESNDWQEEDGVDPDLTAPVLDTRELTLPLAVRDTFRSAAEDRMAGLLDLIADGAYHEFDCAAMGRTYHLRLRSHPKLSFSRTLTTLSVKLSDDFPLAHDRADGPGEGSGVPCGWTVDGRDLADYGVRVLDGSLSQMVTRPDVKEALKRDVAVSEGVMYDRGRSGEATGPVTLKTRDAKLTCLMRARTLEGLWRNWDALLHDLTLPDVRAVGAEALGLEWYGYYKSCSVSQLNAEGRIWLGFTVTLTLTDGFRDRLLASEDGVLICTEDGDSEIDMSRTNIENS